MNLFTKQGSALLLSAFVYGLLLSGPAAADDDLAFLVDARSDEAVALARDLFDYAELGYLETRSSERLAGYLEGNGFSIERGVAGIPTAFVASRGTGGPVIGILAEFDALPGLSQAPVPQRQPLVQGGPGHACGHHLFGTASATAATAIAEWLAGTETPGTVRVYGTPAEEGGSGKVYLTRAGLFDDVDIVLHWHPADRNIASPESSNGNKSGRFRFHGIAAHAAVSPERGRSALDGVEAMNYMTNLMREHMPSTARLHYVITDGGQAPNIVPETAEVYYYVRHPQPGMVVELFDRVVAAAEGAARGTGTAMEYEVMHGNFPLLRNDVLAGVMHGHLERLGGVEYDEAEMAFATTIRGSLFGQLRPLEARNEIEPFEFKQKMGSTDVGDVSWIVPTAGFGTATWVPGTPAHSWQAVAAGGMSIGHKGMMLAARVLAETARDLYTDAELIARAKAEFEERRGPDFEYRPLLGDREPPLDYRK
ncbi:MAG: amidohydrolase [Gammaproteobacteria bacterium]|nr:amidohydrolase [Gammaproteobacteria bacterium]